MLRRNDEVEAQRRRWTFYETINSDDLVKGQVALHPDESGVQNVLK